MKKFLFFIIASLVTSLGHAGEWHPLGPRLDHTVHSLARKAHATPDKDLKILVLETDRILGENDHLLIPPKGEPLKKIIELCTSPHFYQKTIRENFGNGPILPKKMFEVISNKKLLYLKFLKEEGASGENRELAEASLEILQFPLFMKIYHDSKKIMERISNI